MSNCSIALQILPLSEQNEEKIMNFLRFVNILGYKINGKITKITPKAMQDLLNQLKELAKSNGGRKHHETR